METLKRCLVFILLWKSCISMGSHSQHGPPPPPPPPARPPTSTLYTEDSSKDPAFIILYTITNPESSQILVEVSGSRFAPDRTQWSTARDADGTAVHPNVKALIVDTEGGVNVLVRVTVRPSRGRLAVSLRYNRTSYDRYTFPRPSSPPPPPSQATPTPPGPSQPSPPPPPCSSPSKPSPPLNPGTALPTGKPASQGATPPSSLATVALPIIAGIATLLFLVLLIISIIYCHHRERKSRGDIEAIP